MREFIFRAQKIRAKAPLRLGLGGGGTDVAPYSDLYGGVVLNATIALFAHCSVEIRNDDRVVIKAMDLEQEFEAGCDKPLPTDHKLGLIAQVYNRIVHDFLGGKGFAVTITTYCDAPAGSGLGSSSTLVVSVLAAFSEMFGLPLGEYEMAHLAYEIERGDMKLAGGKQDQYAATFGGVNLMEFYADDRVIINPLRLRRAIHNELESSIMLYFTGKSRDSANIIDQQVGDVRGGETKSIEALHALKDQARLMKEALLLGDFQGFGDQLRHGWEEKVKVATKITNPQIDEAILAALDAGAIGGKVSGAGGGGFIMLVVRPENKPVVAKRLAKLSGQLFPCTFTDTGAYGWRTTDVR